jgi:peptidoglycan/LPS O-acetylase OafA/YrhL
MRASRTAFSAGVRLLSCAVITIISALVSAAFSVASLAGAAAGDVVAQYAASRSMALLVGALIAAALRRREGIAALALVMSLVQGFDAIVGALAHDPAKTYGPLALAIANIATLAWLLRARMSGATRKQSPPAKES